VRDQPANTPQYAIDIDPLAPKSSEVYVGILITCIATCVALFTALRLVMWYLLSERFGRNASVKREQ
jgi:hypothetical protein